MKDIPLDKTAENPDTVLAVFTVDKRLESSLSNGGHTVQA